MILVFFLNEETPRYCLTIIFFVASVTDYLDGYVARKMNQISILGKFLDPVAECSLHGREPGGAGQLVRASPRPTPTAARTGAGDDNRPSQRGWR